MLVAKNRIQRNLKKPQFPCSTNISLLTELKLTPMFLGGGRVGKNLKFHHNFPLQHYSVALTSMESTFKVASTFQIHQYR